MVMVTPPVKHRIVLDLCGGTGSWSAPYREAGYDVRLVTMPDSDVRLYCPPPMVWGILAAPPCTHFSLSGARWWQEKGDGPLLEALSTLDACLRIVWVSRPRWWALENPVGRISQYIGPHRFAFNPCDFGDPYTKKTLLWGDFTIPCPITEGVDPSVFPTEGSKLHRLPPSKDRQMLRSKTPRGFADAFFRANP